MTVVEKNLCQRSAKTSLNFRSCRAFISRTAFQLAKFTGGTNCINTFAEIKSLQFLLNNVFLRSDCIYIFLCILMQRRLHIALSRKTAHFLYLAYILREINPLLAMQQLCVICKLEETKESNR